MPKRMRDAHMKRKKRNRMSIRAVGKVMLFASAATFFTNGCATNPITGRQEIQFLSESNEIQVGRQNFMPMQQTQGGELTAFPKVSAYVRQVGQRLARVSHRPQLPYDFVVLDSGVPNAWALPGGKIALNRGLLVELNNEAELAAVLGHEIVHAAARHGAKSIERGLFTQAGIATLGLAFNDKDYRDVVMVGSSVGGALITQKYSRSAELESDRYGIRYMAKAGYDPEAAVELQRTFVRLAEGNHANWLAGMFVSHPPSPKRVEANKRTVARMEKGGTLGSEEFERIIGPLRASQPAYDRLESGYEALKKNRNQEALRLAREAIEIQPAEALFYGLAAKALIAEGNGREALPYLDDAIKINSRYFDFYRTRGLLHRELGNGSQARKDLEMANELLPTAQAHQALGLMALERGKKQEAIAQFRMASHAESPAGRASREMLSRLDVPENPQNYVAVSVHRDDQGYLTIATTNLSALPIEEVQILIHIQNDQGKTVTRQSLRIPDRIQPGTTKYSSTRIGVFPNHATIRKNVRLRVLSARVGG